MSDATPSEQAAVPDASEIIPSHAEPENNNSETQVDIVNASSVEITKPDDGPEGAGAATVGDSVKDDADQQREPVPEGAGASAGAAEDDEDGVIRFAPPDDDQFPSEPTDSGVCDQYGFRVPTAHVENYRRVALLQAERREALMDQWKVLLGEIKGDARGARPLLRAAVLQGIPTVYRPIVWPLLCGIPAYRQQKPGLYTRLVHKASMGEQHEQIALDLDRTFPGHPLLDTIEGMAALNRVLSAFAIFQPKIGYCQSTNFMVGLMLIMDVPEEDAFWMLFHISRVVLPEYYEPPMMGTSIDHIVFADLLRSHLPEVAKHLEKLRLEIAIVCAQWFLCMFSNRMPCETVCRMWDAIFCRGPVALFQLALAVMKSMQDDLLAADDLSDLMRVVRKAEAGLFDVDELLMSAFTDFVEIEGNDITVMRQHARPEVKQQVDDWKARTGRTPAKLAAAQAAEMAKGVKAKAIVSAGQISSRFGSFNFGAKLSNAIGPIPSGLADAWQVVKEDLQGQVAPVAPSDSSPSTQSGVYVVNKGPSQQEGQRDVGSPVTSAPTPPADM